MPKSNLLAKSMKKCKKNAKEIKLKTWIFLKNFELEKISWESNSTGKF
jgi:hypothetical protein